MKQTDIPTSLREASEALARVSDTARLDAELLMAHGLDMDRAQMLMRQRDLEVPDGFAALVARRLAHEPVAYITGKQGFWDLSLTVTPDVLIPRADSESLIEAAERAFAGRAGPETILDLGTGSGALILAALSLFPDASGVATDASAAALWVAKKNADDTGFAERLELQELSWCDSGWEQLVGGPFDLILCNPPYVETGAKLAPMVRDYEPDEALYAGADGLDDYRALLPKLTGLLTTGGVAIFEIGATQAEAVGTLAREAGFTWGVAKDLGGNPRCLTLQKSR